nr:hypothetical protein CPGR_01949 [Mycolicibacterium fortuitum subsp. fortuitum DSM 46621 = ATCC 6841 = JCM 6387]
MRCAFSSSMSPSAAATCAKTNQYRGEPATKSSAASSPARATATASSDRPDRANALEVARAAHTAAVGVTSWFSTAVPRAIDSASSPVWKAKTASIAATRLSICGQRSFPRRVASTARAESGRAHPKNKFDARRQPQRASIASSSGAGTAPANSSSACSPRPCQLIASASTITADVPAP